MMDHWLTPWRTALAFQAAWLESTLAIQKSMAGMALSSPEPTGDPVRDAFRSAADANLRRWGSAAEALQAMPDWYRDAFSMPGSLMTDVFDSARRQRIGR